MRVSSSARVLQGGADELDGHLALHRLAQVVCGSERQPCPLAQQLHHAEAVLGVRVQPRADRAAADAEFLDGFGGELQHAAALAQRRRIRRELLPQANRHGVLQMRAPRLQHMVELPALLRKGVGQRV
jgi:hypothetical protein